MLLALWSPKGGSGTSVLAAACALVLAKDGGARIADLDGDQPAIFGLSSDPVTGLEDWLATGAEAPGDAIERLTVAASVGVALVPRGGPARALAPLAAAEAGAALAVVLRDSAVPTVVDAGRAASPAARALVEVADVSVVVVRGCYLALRRGVASPLLSRAAGAVLVEERGRSLRAREIADVLDRPVLARVPAVPEVARAVDAGVIGARLPEALARPVRQLLGRVGLAIDHRAA